jgi:hypothetical protein
VSCSASFYLFILFYRVRASLRSLHELCTHCKYTFYLLAFDVTQLPAYLLRTQLHQGTCSTVRRTSRESTCSLVQYNTGIEVADCRLDVSFGAKIPLASRQRRQPGRTENRADLRRRSGRSYPPVLRIVPTVYCHTRLESTAMLSPT